MKQVIVIPMNLKMGKGKMVAQGAHASIAAYLKAGFLARKKWAATGMKKVVVKVKDEKELLEIQRAAEKRKIPNAIIIDRGLTQVEPGTITALGIGPDEDEKIDEITGKLKLL